MPSKRFSVGGLKAKYKVPELEFVALSDVETADELRLTYEISFGIGLAILGAAFSNKFLFYISTPFLLLGSIFLIRYILKKKGIKKNFGDN